MKLTEAVDLVENQIESLNKLTNEIGKEVSTKMNEVIMKNQGYEEIKLISRIFNGEQDLIENLKINYTVNEVICFNYAPITSCDVERSFSKYKSFLADNRHSFSPENLKMTFVSYCNSRN